MLSPRQAPHRKIVLAALGLAVIGLTPLVQAAPGCAFESPASDPRERTVDFRMSPASFDFTSRAEGGKNLTGNFDLDSARFALQVPTGNASQVVRLVLEYSAAVEFRDLDGDARLGFGDDVVREFDLPGSPGATLQGVPRMRAGSYEALAKYPLNGSALFPGMLEIRFVVLSRPEIMDGEERAAERIYVETALESFPFLRNDTRLALRVRQVTNANLSAGPDEVLAQGGNALLSYRWSSCMNDGLQTGRVGPVVVEYPSGAVPRTATIFAFPDADRIEHASSIGIAQARLTSSRFDVSTLLPSGDWIVFTAGTVGAAFAIGLSAWRRLRGA